MCWTCQRAQPYTRKRERPEGSVQSAFHGRATQLRFIDGSLLRNDFTNVVTNPKLDDSLFQPVIGSDYQVSQPATLRRTAAAAPVIGSDYQVSQPAAKGGKK